MTRQHTGPTYLGIDIGTSGVKAVMIDTSGKPLANATAPLSVRRPQPGWCEQDPADWWRATLQVIDALSKSDAAALGRVRGLGLSGQMYGATLLGADYQVLRPAILWNDGRADVECAQIEQACATSREITGNIAMPGFTAPKIQWVQNHEPRIFEKIRKVLLPKDYVRWMLSGEFFSDMSDASGTLWLDVAQRSWSAQMLAATGLDQSHMPELAEGTAVAGTLKPEFLSRWGMSGPVVLAGGAGDNAASACGIGAIQPGDGFVSLGTSGVLFVCNPKFSPNTAGAVHAFCHAIPDTWHQMGVILSATDSLNWLAALTGGDATGLALAAEENFTGPGDEVFLPYLSGERTPHNNTGARASFAGLSHRSDPTRMAQAVMEGVAFAFRDCQRVLGKAGTQFQRLIAVGGGSKSDLWLRLIATNLDIEIAVPRAGDFGGAFGAARLAICAHENAAPADICTTPKIAKTITPDTGLQAAYSEQYARFRALYPAIEDTLT